MAVAVHPVYAQSDRRASLTVKIALDPSISGKVTAAGNATINGTPAVFTDTGWSASHSKNSPLLISVVLRF